MHMTAAPPWALILAGGDGTRLRALTRQITGDPRPKQFCPLLDGETLLDRTRRRVDVLTPFDRQVVVVTRPHEPYYRPLLADLAPGRLVVQARNRGTGPGLLYPLLRITELAGGDVPLAVFPSDHFVDDDAKFVGAVQAALDATRARGDLVTLLGVEADQPETEYGWIEPHGDPLALDGEPVFPIRRFWEKPSADLAAGLFSRGCLWNSFVMVGRVSAFLELIAVGAPELMRAFEPIRRAGDSREERVAERVYASLPEVNFSQQVLVPAAERLGVVRVKGVEWSDWGNAERVFATIKRTGWRPRWLDSLSEGGFTPLPSPQRA